MRDKQSIIKEKGLKIKVFRKNHKKKTTATVMIVTMKNFLTGEQKRCHDVGMVIYNMSVIVVMYRRLILSDINS